MISIYNYGDANISYWALAYPCFPTLDEPGATADSATTNFENRCDDIDDIKVFKPFI